MEHGHPNEASRPTRLVGAIAALDRQLGRPSACARAQHPHMPAQQAAPCLAVRLRCMPSFHELDGAHGHVDKHSFVTAPRSPIATAHVMLYWAYPPCMFMPRMTSAKRGQRRAFR